MRMKLKVLALSLSFLFLGSMATSKYAMTTDAVYKTVNVGDDDDNKTKAKNKKAKASSECTPKQKSECCTKSCDGKKASASSSTSSDKK